MSEYLVSLEGTEAGARAALMLALLAAFLHAIFGSLQKGRLDPWTARTSIDVYYGLFAMPVALFIVPWPEPHMWLIFAGTILIHTGYKLAQASAYTYGAYTVVYPVVRGTGPLFAVIGAGIVFGERFTALQWVGMATLVTGIFGLAVYNLVKIRIDRDRLWIALGLALLTGGFVAAYTTYDAYGIRATADPFTFLAWFFMLDGIAFPVAWLLWKRRMPRLYWPAVRLGVTGALVAYFSFGGIMLATRLDNVGEAAVIRETSVVFAALIGWFILKEPVGPRRLTLIGLIALGAVIVEAGG